MDPTERGWIEKFIEIRLDKSILKRNEGLSFEKDFYKYLQPTGIIYGHPLQLPNNFIETKDFPIKERMEVILVESLFSASLFHKNTFSPTEDQLKEIVVDLNNFYDGIYPQLSKKGFFEKKPKNNIERLEKIIRNRVEVKKEWNTNFWRGFFQNILLFTDVIIYLEYLKSDSKLTADELQKVSKDLQWNIIYLLSVVIKLSNKEATSDNNYFHYYIDSTNFSKEEKEKANLCFKESNIEKVFHFLDSANWITRKYFLELALLSIWADHSVNLSEKKFFDELSIELKLDTTEIAASSLAIEAFVMNNWTKIHYLQSKQNYLVLSKRLTQRMKLISHKYVNEIKQEIEDNKELIHLLGIAQRRPLSIEEKNKVREQLIDVLKTIPTFVILALPGSFLTVPILMKILPKEVLPSSFDPNMITQSRRSGIIEG
jgi:hypothetical protein